MDRVITCGAWKGHLGRGLAPKELQYLLGTAQAMTAKQIARQFDLAACTVAKRFSCAMFKLGVTRQTTMISEAMRRQIILPMCFALAALIAMHAMIGREQPLQKIHYQVVTPCKAYHIVERATGKVRGFRWTHKKAVSFAELLKRRINLSTA